MLNILADGTIQLTRGDTARITVSITNSATEQSYSIASTDVLELTVRKAVSDAESCIHKTLTGSGTFHILPADTKDLNFGKYKYDVQLTTDAGDVYTVIGPSTFEILQEVTY